MLDKGDGGGDDTVNCKNYPQYCDGDIPKSSNELIKMRGGPGRPKFIVPNRDNNPCGELISCKPTLEDFVLSQNPISHADVCKFFHLDPGMCDARNWPSLPTIIVVPPNFNYPGVVAAYCGNSSGLGCLANLAQDVATVTDMVGVGLIETPALVVGCFEGGPLGCAIAEVGAAATWTVTLNVVETAASSFSLGLAIADDLLTNHRWGENSSTSAVTWAAGLLPLTPSWDLLQDGYSSGYNHGVFNGIYTIGSQGLLK